MRKENLILPSVLGGVMVAEWMRGYPPTLRRILAGGVLSVVLSGDDKLSRAGAVLVGVGAVYTSPIWK